MQNILFVLYHDFSSNSAIHVHHFANELVKQGFSCTVAVPDNKRSISSLGKPLYTAIEFREIDAVADSFENRNGPDIVHAWTPREIVREFCVQLRKRYRFFQIVHLEDNEDLLLERFAQKPIDEILKQKTTTFPRGLSHPIRYRTFLENSDGVTVIIDRLEEFVPANVPRLLLWPGVDTHLFYPRARDPDAVFKLRIPLNSTVICYTGNVHLANAHDVRSLYLAVAMLNREGYPTTLVRSGRDSCDFLGHDARWAKKYSVELGYLEKHQMLPEILAIADILVQPGKADAFNDYRFPSKLPEFLAMGKPVILPDTNIGHHLNHQENAMVLPRVDAINIVETVKHLRDNPALCERLGKGASTFAQTHLNWTTNAEKLFSFYKEVASSVSSVHR